MYDLLIIGGGAAALAALLYARTKDLNAALLYDEFGGKVGWHPVGPDVDQYRADQLRWTKHDRPDLPAGDLLRMLVDRVRDQPRRLLQDRALSVERGIGFLRVDTRARRTRSRHGDRGKGCGTTLVTGGGREPLGHAWAGLLDPCLHRHGRR